MVMLRDSEYLEKAYKRLGRKAWWCLRFYAVDEDGARVDATSPRAVKWCGMGALVWAMEGNFHRAADLAHKWITEGHDGMVSTNDEKGYTAVRRLLKEAMERAKEAGE